MKIITVTGPAPGYTAHTEGRPIFTADRLSDMRGPLGELLAGYKERSFTNALAGQDELAP